MQSAQRAHVHGLANLTIVLDNQTLLIKFESPLMDILGFEGKPRTKVQRESIKTATEKFRKTDDVLTLNGGSCRQQQIRVNLGHVDMKNDTHHGHNDRTHDDNHSEISAVYEFNCSEPQNLNRITILLFNQFSNMEKIKARWVHSDLQGQNTLIRNNNVINFR